MFWFLHDRTPDLKSPDPDSTKHHKRHNVIPPTTTSTPQSSHVKLIP